MQCEEEVWERPGYWHHHRCPFRSKWVVTEPDGVLLHVCGNHVGHYRSRKDCQVKEA